MHAPPALVPPRDGGSDPRINQSTGRGRVSDFPDFRRKSGKSDTQGGRNQDLSGWGHGVDHDAAGL